MFNSSIFDISSSKRQIDTVLKLAQAIKNDQRKNDQHKNDMIQQKPAQQQKQIQIQKVNDKKQQNDQVGLGAGIKNFQNIKNQLQAKSRQKLFQAMSKLSESKLYQESVIKKSGYSIGTFSNFAIQVQSQMYKKKLLIDLVLRQAIISYKKKIQENQNNIREMTSLEKLQINKPKQFSTQQKIKQYIKDPLLFQQQLYKKVKWGRGGKRIVQIMQQIFSRRTYVRSLAIADNKFVQINKLKFSQRFYMGQNLFLSTQVNNLYIKISKSKKPVKVMLFQNGFYQKQQLKGLSQDMKKQILGMVILFLKHQGTILQKDQIGEMKLKIDQLIQQLKNNLKP